MSGLKELRNRVGSVNSTRKITKAMQVVSAAKLKKLKEQAEQLNHFSDELGDMMNDIAKSANPSDLPEKDRKFFDKGICDLPKLLVVMTSERGLCGGFNSQVVKAVKNDIMQFKSEGKEVSLIVIGKKGYDALKGKYSDVIEEYFHLGRNDAACVSIALRRRIIDMIEAGKVGNCYLYYNKFKNAMTQVMTRLQVLPAGRNASDEFSDKSLRAVGFDKTSSFVSQDDGHKYEYEGRGLVRDVINLYLDGQINYGLLQSKASEEGARMTAMDNATRNAGDLIDRLRLQLNRSRQANITTELTEIISGSEAI